MSDADDRPRKEKRGVYDGCGHTTDEFSGTTAGVCPACTDRPEDGERGGDISEQEHYTGYVSFYRYNGQWKASILDDPPSNPVGGKFWRIRIPVPREIWQGEGDIAAKVEEAGGTSQSTSGEPTDD